MAEITKDSTLAEILKIPDVEEVLAKYNLPCLWCPMAKLEADKLKIGQICEMYNINIGNLLKALNKIVSKKCKKLQKNKKSNK